MYLHLSKHRLWWGVASCVALVALLVSTPAVATLSGYPPEYAKNFRIWGSAAVTGNTLMYDEGTVNFALIPGGTDGIIDELPANATVEAAYLFWSASFDPDEPFWIDVDRDIDFSIPAGRTWNDLSVDFLEPGEGPEVAAFNRCLVVEAPVYSNMQHYYMCRRDVTAMVAEGSNLYNGAYHVDDVQAAHGDCDLEPVCQAKFAGWSLIIVWSSPSENVRRDVVLYDGFYLFDEENGPFSSGVSPWFTLDRFEVGDPARGALSFFALEGDEQLGVPPQDLQNCSTCYDFFQVYTEQNPLQTKLSDDVNFQDNIYNGSRARGGSSPGVDLDTYNISPLLRTGDSYMRFRMGSGDGVAGGEGGGGELVLMGYVIISLETFSPDFNNTFTYKTVAEDTAAPGTLLHYSIRVTNTGSEAAHNVRVRDPIPAGTTYVPGTSTACGAPLSDIGGMTPLALGQGYNIGTLFEAPPGRQSCEIKFQVRVNNNVSPGTDVINRATLSSDETEPLELVATSHIEGLSLATPSKTVVDVNGGDLVPGDVVTYTVTVFNSTDASVDGISLSDPVPPELENVTVVVVPPGADNNSSANQIMVDDIQVGAQSSATVVFTGQVRDDVASGTPLVNQGYVSHPALSAPLATDDPAIPGSQDPTVITVYFSIDLTSSVKNGVDVNGGNAEPGDLLRYTITLVNSGSIAATANVDDDLPFGLEACQLVYRPPGSTVGCYAGGAFGAGEVRGRVAVPAGSTRQIVFEARIVGGASSGLSIQNRADITYTEDPTALVTVAAQPFVIVAGPVLTSSTKSVVDLSGPPTRPGDGLRYTITVTNSGNRPAHNIVVSDVLDANLENPFPEDGGQFGGNTIVWDASTTPTLAEIPAGQSRSVHFVASIRENLPNGTVIRNSAALVADEVATPVVVNANPLVVTAEALLVLSKTVEDLNGEPYEPGDVVRYVLTLGNIGDAPATQVVVRDPVDPSLENPLPRQGGRLDGGQVVWDALSTVELEQIDVNETVELVFEATLRELVDHGTVVSNQAQATSSQVPLPVLSDDPTQGGAQDPTVFVVSALPVLSLKKAVLDDNGGEFVPGETVTYTLTIDNTGLGSALNVVVSDTFPAELDQLNATPAPSQQVGNSLQWDASTVAGLARLFPGEPVEIIVTARIVRPLADGTAVSNQGSVQAQGVAAVLSDNPATPQDGDPTVFFVRSIAVLSTFEKTAVDQDGDGEFRPNNAVRYLLRIVNTGSEAATNVVLTDEVPPQLTGVATPHGQVSGNSVRFDSTTLARLASLAPDEELTVYIDGTLQIPLDPGIEVSNQASITADGLGVELSDDPATPDLDDPTVFAVTSAPDLTGLTKSVSDLNGGSVRPGDLLQYEIEIRNDGDANASGVWIMDPIDPNLTIESVSDNGENAAGALSWRPDTTPVLTLMAPGDSLTVTFTATVAAPLDNNTRIANQAVAFTVDNPEPVPSDDPATLDVDDETVVFVVSAADLSTSTKRVTDPGGSAITEARPGDSLMYHITISNTGDAVARNVAVSDVVDGNLTVGTISDGGQFDGSSIQWPVGSIPALLNLAPNQQVELSFGATLKIPLDPGLLISNQAQMLPEEAVNPFVTDDPATPEASDRTTITVVSAPDLSTSTKAFIDVNGDDPEPDDHIRYEITVINTGDALAREVVISDVLDTTNLTNITVSQGNFSAGGATFDSSTAPGLLAVGLGVSAAVQLTIEADIVFPLANGTVVSNQATLQATDLAPVPSDDPATATQDDATRFTVVSVPRMQVTKALLTPTTRIVAPGGDASYQIEVSNGGTATANNAVLTDALPPEVEFITSSQGTYDGPSHTLTVDLGDLPPRSNTTTFTVAVRVLADIVDETIVSNQAQVAADGMTPAPSDDPLTPEDGDATNFVVRAVVDLSGSPKTVSDLNGDEVRPGDELRYSISVVNQGNTPAREAVVIDELPEGLLPVAAEQGGRIDGQRVTWDAATTPGLALVPVGEPLDLHFLVRIASSVADGTVLSNQGSITTTTHPEGFVTDDPSTPSVIGDPTLVTVQAPHLQVSKRVTDENGGVVRPGDILSYAIELRNSGSVALRQASVRDELPDLVAVEAIENGGQLQGTTLVWTPATTPTLAQIESNQAATVVVRLRVDPRALGGQEISNQALVESLDLFEDLLSDDPATPAVADPTVVAVDAEVDFSQSTKVAVDPPQPLKPGDEVEFKIVVRNSGTQYASQVSVTDAIDPAMFTDVVPADGGSFAAGVVSWNSTDTPALAEMAPGDEVELGLRVTVVDSIANNALVENTAQIMDNAGELFATPPVQLRVESLPSFATSSKTVEDQNGGQVEPGDVLVYRITVRNEGTEVAESVVLRDAVPAGTIYIPGTTQVATTPVADVGQLSALVTGLQLGQMQRDAEIEVQFAVRVMSNVLRGTVIENQGFVSATDVVEVGTDDPSTPSILGDPTRVVVGGGVALVATLIATPRQVDGGERFDLNLTLVNAGTVAANDVVFELPMISGATYQSDSMVLDGQPLSDAVDSDAGEMTGSRLRLRQSALEPSRSLALSITLEAAGNVPVLLYQGSVQELSGAAGVLTDGDLLSPGVQPTTVIVGDPIGDLSTSSLSGQDLNGGALLPGDEIRYHLLVANTGTAPVQLSVPNGLVDALSPVATFVDGSFAGTIGAEYVAASHVVQLDQPMVLEADKRASLFFSVVVKPTASNGSSVVNTAVVRGDTLEPVTLGPIRMMVGGIPGTGRLKGRVYEDVGGELNQFDTDVDQIMEGFQVILRRHTENEIIASDMTDSDGNFAFAAVPSGRIEVSVLSETGTLFRKLTIGHLEAEVETEQDILIDPSGVVYDAQSGGALSGVQLFLFVEDGDDNPDNDVLAGSDRVDPTQQGQISNRDGLYRFDVAPGQYRLGLVPSSPTQLFPSLLLPPNNDDHVAHPFGGYAVTDEQHRVVEAARPNPRGDTTYFLRFDIADLADEVLHNHIPLDPLKSHVTLVKTASHKRITLGDIVTYTVRYTNASPLQINLGGDGGVNVVDAIPKGFKYLKGSTRLERMAVGSDGAKKRRTVSEKNPKGNRLMVFGPYELRGHSEYLLRYQMVAAPNVDFGEHENIAVLRTANGQTDISNRATAKVTVAPDPIFDLGTVIGKVYCDKDGSGFQNDNELPLPGATIYIDTGRHAETDIGGKFHFSALKPGTHLLKLDLASLPPGSELTTPQRVNIYVTRGLPSRISYGVRCGFEQSRGALVRVAAPPPSEDAGPVEGTVIVSGVLTQRRVVLDGAEQATVRTDLGLGLGDDDRDFSNGPGPNPAAIDPVSGLAPMLHFYPKTVSALPLATWRLAITTLAGEDVYAFAGDGEAPEDVAWDGRDAQTGAVLLQNQTEYRSQLVVVAVNGDWGASAQRAFAVGVGASARAKVGYRVVLDEVDGRLFDPRGKARKRLKRFIKKAAAEIKSRSKHHVVVTVHADDKAGIEAVALTANRAAEVRDLLAEHGVERSRMEAIGAADKTPLVPNIGKRGRAKNRRIEIRTMKPAQRGPAIAAPQYPGRVAVNGVELSDLADSTAFRHELLLQSGDQVEVDLTAPSGGRVVMTRTYQGAPFVEGAAAALSSEGVVIRGDIGARTVHFGEQQRSMALLDTRAEVMGGAHPELDLSSNGLSSVLTFSLSVPPQVNVASYRLQVFAPAEEPAVAPEVDNPVLPGSGGDDADPVLVPVLPPTETADGGVQIDAAVAVAKVDAGGSAWGSQPVVPFGELPPIPEPPASRVGRVVREFSADGPPPTTLPWQGTNLAGEVVVQPGWYGYRLLISTLEGEQAISAPGWFRVVGDAVLETALLSDPFARGRKKLKQKDLAILQGLVSRHGAAAKYRVLAHTDNSLNREKSAGATHTWAQAVSQELQKSGAVAANISAAGKGSSEPLVPNTGRRSRAKNRRVTVEILGAKQVATAAPAPHHGAPYIEVNSFPLQATMGQFETKAFVGRQGLIRVRAVLPSGAEATWRYHKPLPEMEVGDEAMVPPLPAVAVDAGVGEDGGLLAAPLVAVPGGEEFIDYAPGSGLTSASVSEDGGLQLAMAQGVDGGIWIEDAAAIPAANLAVDLPPQNSVLTSRRLAVRGTTSPGNKLQVNGKEVDVDVESGEFATIIDLPEGASTVKVETKDIHGNEGYVTREVTVDSNGLFVLAMADTALAGRDADLPEWNEVNHLKLGPAAVYGRGAALVKAKWSGETFFKQYDLTLHIDTSRWQEDAFEQELLDPERYYPVYADSSVEVIDAEARYPVFAELKADKSLLRIGNFRTQLGSGDLFRYERARYGLLARFDKPLFEQEKGAPILDTDVSAFVAGGDAPRRHGRVELRGTGGSLYYLAHDNIVEGSERVHVLVRDGITGTELMRRPMARNIDYTVRYVEGRMLLSMPLSSTAESGMMANQNVSTVYAGHPVYLEVEYEHEDENDFNQVGAGLYAEETVLGHVTVGGGYVYEGRAGEDPAYQLAGANLKLAYDKSTFVQGEWAYSRSVSMDNYLSNDGGLTFTQIGQQPNDPAVMYGRVLFPAEREGHAFKVRGQTSLGGLWGANPDDLALRSYFQRLAPGFSAGSTVSEAGQTKYGLEGRYIITKRDTMRLRYDGVWSQIPQVPQITEYRTLHRELAMLQYQRRQESFTATGEYAFAYTWDSGAFGQSAFAEEREVFGNTVAAGIEYYINKRLTLIGRQEGIITGDDRQLPSWSDHLITTAGARYKLTEDLKVSLMESLRWSGENATTLGLQSKLNEHTDVYARERFNMRSGNWLTSTVVGASGRMNGNTKAYGEYQLDGAMAGTQSRAVMGMGSQFKILKGFMLSLGYERTQVFGGSGMVPATGTLPPAALTDSYSFAASGAYGAGAMYVGSGSRDAVSAGVDYTALKFLKAAAKLELRYDNLDEERGGQDRFVVLTQGAVTWNWTRDLAMLARFNWADVQNRTLEFSEAGLQDISLGVAYRPVRHEWISILSKYARRLEHRPVSLVEGAFEEYSADVLSVEPIFELPWGLQVVEKLALKYSREQIDDLPVGEAVTLLWINRLNVHALRLAKPWFDGIPGDIDVGAEWRVLTQFQTGTTEQGLLFELAYAPVEYVRFGLGWNFTSFSDEEFARNNEDHSGLFFRVVGQY